MHTTTIQRTFTDKVVDFIQSIPVLIIALIMVLAYSTPNNIEVLSKINRLPYIPIEHLRWLAASFAIMLEVVILIYACIGQAQAAKYYAIASFFFHIAYYHRWDEVLVADYNNPLQVSEVITNLATSLLTSYMISGSIHFLSKQIKVKIEEQKIARGIQDIKKLNADLINQNASLTNQIADYKTELTLINTQITEGQESLAQVMQNKAQSLSKYLELEEKTAKLNEQILSIKRAKAGLSRGEMNDEIRHQIDQIK